MTITKQIHIILYNEPSFRNTKTVIFRYDHLRFNVENKERVGGIYNNIIIYIIKPNSYYYVALGIINYYKGISHTLFRLCKVCTTLGIV